MQSVKRSVDLGDKTKLITNILWLSTMTNYVLFESTTMEYYP